MLLLALLAAMIAGAEFAQGHYLIAAVWAVVVFVDVQVYRLKIVRDRLDAFWFAFFCFCLVINVVGGVASLVTAKYFLATEQFAVVLYMAFRIRQGRQS